MPIQLSSFLVPRTGNSWFLIEDIYVKGGYQIHPTVESRDLIVVANRKSGMLVHTVSENKTWRLNPDLVTWIESMLQGLAGPAGATGPQGIQGIQGPAGSGGTGGLTEAPVDSKRYVRLNATWVELAASLTDVTPAAPGYYVRTSSGWVRLDRYDLAVASTNAVLDLSARQIFTVDATISRTLSFTGGPPSGRAMTVVITFTGTGGVITWPPGISWDGGTAPTLGATLTVVVLLWTGTQWVGSITARI